MIHKIQNIIIKTRIPGEVAVLHNNKPPTKQLLSKTAYEVLLYLVKNQDTVVKNKDILDNCFSDDCDPYGNSVAVYIAVLRRKLGHELIETRVGYGYLISSK